MGGGIALRAAIERPDLVEQAILVAPAGFSYMRSMLYKIELPVNLIWGTEDAVIDLSYGRRFHDLMGGSTLTTIKGGSHALYLDKTAQFFSLVKNLLLDE